MCKIVKCVHILDSTTTSRLCSNPNASTQVDVDAYTTGWHTGWIPYADA